jgi:hypothetical protein
VLRLRRELAARLEALAAEPWVRRLRVILWRRRRALLTAVLAAGIVAMVIHWS